MRTTALDWISFHEKASSEGQDVGEAGRPVSRLFSEEIREVMRAERPGKGVSEIRARVSKGLGKTI